MKIVRSKNDLIDSINELEYQGKRIGFVPTMGALHKGHLSLIEAAKKRNTTVIVSIFVNPTQFAPDEDFDSYPRREETDIEKLKLCNVDLVYIPSVKDIYPDGPQVEIKASDKGNILCGASRPGHFDGVLTVVNKLLKQTRASIAVFGEKDYQQLFLIREMVKEQNLDVEIIASPTIRESDGLAMSSRNSYLSPEERQIAPQIYKNLQQIAEGSSIEEAKLNLENIGFEVDYIEILNNKTLEPTDIAEENAIIFAAVTLGDTRLIDNLSKK